MSTLMLWAVMAVYAVGLFPAAVKTARWSATSHTYCHQESRSGAIFKSPNQHHCATYCKPGCWRSDGIPTFRDLRVTPVALIWPLLGLGVMILRQAGKVPPKQADLQSEIARLEKELGIGDHA